MLSCSYCSIVLLLLHCKIDHKDMFVYTLLQDANVFQGASLQSGTVKRLMYWGFSSLLDFFIGF